MGVEIARTTHRVQIKPLWGDDWEDTSHLICESHVHAAAPSYGQARFHFHFGNIVESNATPSFAVRNPIELNGYFVRVFETEPEAEERLVWVGQFVDQIDDLVRFDMKAGTSILHAFELPFILDRMTIARGLVLRDGSQQLISDCPAFNRSSSKGLDIIGNRSADPFLTTPVDFYLFDEVDEDADPAAAQLQCWSAIQAFHHVFHWWMSTLFPVDWELVWPAGTLEDIYDIWEVDGKTLWEAVNQIINRRYGLCLTLKIDVDDKWNLRVDTVVKTDLTIGGATIPANDHQITLTIPSDANAHTWRSLSLRQTQVSQYGQILVRGNLIKCMGTFVGDGVHYQLDKWWSAAQEAAYVSAGGATDPDVADRRRSSEKYDGVFTRIILPKTWDGTCDSDGTPVPLLIKFDTDTGADTSQVGEFWLGSKSFERQWLFRKGWDYNVLPPAKDAGSNAKDDFFPMRAWIFDGISGNRHEATNKWIAIDRIVESIPTMNVSMHLLPLDKQLGIEISVTPQHMLAGDGFTGVTDIKPEFNWTSIVVTTVIEHDQRVRKKHVISSGPPERQLVIDTDADLWYVAPGTVIGVDQDGELLRYAGADFIRDGRDRIDQVLAAAVSWYGEPRQAIKIPLKQIKHYCDLGNMITDITGATLTFPINAIVTSISTNYTNQTVDIETGWGHLDYSPDFGGSFTRRRG